MFFVNFYIYIIIYRIVIVFLSCMQFRTYHNSAEQSFAIVHSTLMISTKKKDSEWTKKNINESKTRTFFSSSFFVYFLLLSSFGLLSVCYNENAKTQCRRSVSIYSRSLYYFFAMKLDSASNIIQMNYCCELVFRFVLCMLPILQMCVVAEKLNWKKRRRQTAIFVFNNKKNSCTLKYLGLMSKYCSMHTNTLSSRFRTVQWVILWVFLFFQFFLIVFFVHSISFVYTIVSTAWNHWMELLINNCAESNIAAKKWKKNKRKKFSTLFIYDKYTEANRDELKNV